MQGVRDKSRPWLASRLISCGVQMKELLSIKFCLFYSSWLNFSLADVSCKMLL